MLDLRIDAHEVADLAFAWENAPGIVIAEMSAAVLEGSLLLERETRENTPVGASGGAGLRASIAAQEPRVLADQVIGVTGSALKYAVPVELGTKPHFPPVQPLADWAVRKLGVPREDAERVGFAIARKISKEGTEGAHMFAHAFERTGPQIRAMFDAAHARIRARLAEVAR